MAITINLYYTGTNGNARKFAEEMESSGTAVAIRKEVLPDFSEHNSYIRKYPK